MSQLMSHLTASLGAAGLSSLSDDDVFDDSAGTSPLAGLPFSFHPTHLAQFQAQAGLQAQSQRRLQQQQQAQLQQQQQQQHQLLLQQQRHPSYQAQLQALAAAQAASPAPYVPTLPYPLIDPLDAWLAMSAYNQRSPLFDFGLGPWGATLPLFPGSPTSTRSTTSRKKSSTSSQHSPADKKVVEEVDVTLLTPRDAIMKAKVRLSNLADWKAYTKNNAWTPEVILGEPFAVPINIKFIQLVPTAQYIVSIGFALREDTPGLMSFSDETLQWNSIEGAVHKAPRRTSPVSPPREDKAKVDMVLMDSLPPNTIPLNGGEPLTGKELMMAPREFTDLVVVRSAEDEDQIALRPYYKYSPCLYLSLLDEESDHETILLTRKVMIHDIKMVPVEHLHNPMLATL